MKNTKAQEKPKAPTKAELLNIALTEKGELSKSFNLFRQYSINNIIWLFYQMKSKNIPVTPVKTYKQWQEVGRQVNKGAEGLYMVEMRQWEDKEESEKQGRKVYKTYYPVTKTHFAMAQTSGENALDKLNEYYKLNIENIKKNLNVTFTDFSIMNGNVQGYAKTKNRTIAINPLDKEFVQTFTHELAHIILHQERELSKELREVEAEATCFLTCSLIDNNMDLSSSRAYIQGYMKNAGIKELPKENADRIFTAVDIILSASDNKTDKMNNALNRLK